MTVPLHILVVDDYPQVVGYFKQYLETYGHRIETAANGIEAINALQRCARANDPVHLVLADVIMPLLDGLSLVKEMRRDRQATPVALMTGNPEMLPNLLVDAQRLGCIAVLNKPIDPGQLAQVLATAAMQAANQAAQPRRDVPPHSALERQDNTRSYQPSTATVARQHIDDPFRPLTASQYPPQAPQPPQYTSANYAPQAYPAPGQPQQPQYPQQPPYPQQPQQGYPPQQGYAQPPHFGQPGQGYAQPPQPFAPQAPLAPPLPPPMTSRNASRVDLPILDPNAIRVAERPSGGYPLAPAPPAVGSGGYALVQDGQSGSGGYQMHPQGAPPQPRDPRQTGSLPPLAPPLQPGRDLRQSGAQPTLPSGRDPRYTSGVSNAPRAGANDQRSSFAINPGQGNGPTGPVANPPYDPRASNSGTTSPDPRFSSGANKTYDPRAHGSGTLPPDPRLTRPAEPRITSGINQHSGANPVARPPADPRITGGINQHSGANPVARPPADPRITSGGGRAPPDPRYASGAAKPSANDPRFASGANQIPAQTNPRAPVAYPVGRTGTPQPGPPARTTSGIYPPGTIPTNTVPAPGGYQRTNSGLFQGPPGPVDQDSGNRMRRGIGGAQGQPPPTGAPPQTTAAAPAPGAGEAGRMLACAYCGGAFRAAVRSTVYNLVCVHCGQLNRIDP